MNYTAKILLTFLFICLSPSVFAEVIEIKGEHLTVTFEDSVSNNVAGYNVYINEKRFNGNTLIKSGYKIKASEFGGSDATHTIYVKAQSAAGIESERTPVLTFKVASTN